MNLKDLKEYAKSLRETYDKEREYVSIWNLDEPVQKKDGEVKTIKNGETFTGEITANACIEVEAYIEEVVKKLIENGVPFDKLVFDITPGVFVEKNFYDRLNADNISYGKHLEGNSGYIYNGMTPITISLARVSGENINDDSTRVGFTPFYIYVDYEQFIKSFELLGYTVGGLTSFSDIIREINFGRSVSNQTNIIADFKIEFNKKYIY